MENCEKREKEDGNLLHFWELTDKCMFWLDKKFWDKFYSSKKSNATKAQFIPLDNLIKLSDASNISPKGVEKHIKLSRYSTKGKPIKIKFPISFLTEEWSGLVGAILSEGHISEDLDLSFWNKDKEVIDKFIELTEKIEPNLIESRDAYKVTLPKIVSQILISGLNFHKGDKVTADPCLPKIYMNINLSKKENRDVICSLLSWLFTGDGWISLFKDHLGRTHRHMGIGFSVLSNNKPPRLLEDTRKLLINLRIKPQRICFNGNKTYFKKGKEQKTESWKFFINGKNNFQLFQEKINFQDTRRKEVLEKSIESFVKPNLRKGEAIIKVVSFVVRNKTCTKHQIIRDLGLRNKRIEAVLREAKKKGFVKIIGGGDKTKQYGRNPYIYEPTIDGIKFVKEKGDKFL